MKSLRALGASILALLRELADENAYRRYLDAHGLAPTPQAWRAFWDERAKMRYSKAKCC
jgi:hypothetical protein